MEFVTDKEDMPSDVFYDSEPLSETEDIENSFLSLRREILILKYFTVKASKRGFHQNFHLLLPEIIKFIKPLLPLVPVSIPVVKLCCYADTTWQQEKGWKDIESVTSCGNTSIFRITKYQQFRCSTSVFMITKHIQQPEFYLRK